MFKFIFGIIVGVVTVTYYPEISTALADWFVDSGSRDTVIKTLERM